MSAADFWNDSVNSRKVVKQLKALKSTVEPWQQASKKYQELQELAGILKTSDQELILELDRNTSVLLKEIDALEF